MSNDVGMGLRLAICLGVGIFLFLFSFVKKHFLYTHLLPVDMSFEFHPLAFLCLNLSTMDWKPGICSTCGAIASDRSKTPLDARLKSSARQRGIHDEQIQKQSEKTQM